MYHLLLLLTGSLGIFSFILIWAIFNPKLFLPSPKHIEIENTTSIEISDDRIIDGIHVGTGLKDAPGLNIVIQNCTNCHSAQLLIQNRMSRTNWSKTIDWMQETQNLWDLGKNEDIIINYLVSNYPVIAKGRRQNLKDITWYELK